MADETKQEEKKMEEKVEHKTEEKKEMKKEEPAVKKDEKKEVKVVKKEEAITKGTNLHASMRQCMYICRFIKNKSIDDAIKDLEDVILYKKIVPFKGEIPHRKGKIMSGRYPINVSKLFIPMLKTLKGNVLANKMELDKTRIYFASACYASRPSKRGGGRFKRANLVLKAKEAVK
jgi:ribosomal protein L22